MKKFLQFALVALIATFALNASATDYVYSVPLGQPMNESVRYGFNDTVSFTPTVSGNYNVDVIANNAYGGCSTRYCHSKWSIIVNFTVASIGAVSLLPNGNATLFMQAGQTYVLNIQGSGSGTGTYAGYGAYGVSFAQVN